MRRILVILAVAALALAGLVTAANARSDSRPFKGEMSGSVLFAPDPVCTNNPWTMRTDSVASGNVSHLGRTDMTSSHCTPAETEVTGGEMTLFAANGDEVYIQYAGFAPGPDLDTGIIYVELNYVIVGGDGRFEGAHGGGQMTAEVVFEGFDDPEWPASWSWTGTIGY